MEAIIPEEEQEETLKKKFKPKVIQGGLAIGGGEPPNKSRIWLLDLEPGTIFLVYNKLEPFDYLMPQFMLVEKTDDSNVRLLTQGSTDIIDVYIHPERFCKKYELAEVRGIRKLDE